MLVVLDTNVLISALLYKKRLGKIGDLIEQGSLTPCFIASTWRELESVLRYPKFQPKIKSLNTTPEEIAQSLSLQSAIFPDPNNVPKLVTHSGDNFILATTIAAKASYIITGDKELLALKKFKNTSIISPVQFTQIVL
ncbi:MAG: putative toxin-antitoxin system toxin component, PIN family [Candidatus Doudnabacteria bacterium]|nr:putative toxin-antitoxin system toxin component, PIN family [Candidatus Doudnabacteria bacterium]